MLAALLTNTKLVGPSPTPVVVPPPQVFGGSGPLWRKYGYDDDYEEMRAMVRSTVRRIQGRLEEGENASVVLTSERRKYVDLLYRMQRRNPRYRKLSRRLWKKLSTLTFEDTEEPLRNHIINLMDE